MHKCLILSSAHQILGCFCSSALLLLAEGRPSQLAHEQEDTKNERSGKLSIFLGVADQNTCLSPLLFQSSLGNTALSSSHPALFLGDDAAKDFLLPHGSPVSRVSQGILYPRVLAKINSVQMSGTSAPNGKYEGC